MAFWTIAILLLSISFLVVRHLTTAMDYLPHWLRPAKQPEREDANAPNGSSTRPSETHAEDAASPAPQSTVGVDDGESTPKAQSTALKDDVPTFSLSSDDQAAESTAAQPAATLMPPPARPAVKAPANTAASRLIPNRGPPLNSPQRASGGLTAGAVPVSSARGKVLLSPGHSPMDWAALTRKGNISGVATFQRVTPSMLKKMTGRKGKPAWTSWQNKVYNITPYLPFHPGGEAELMKAAGRDATKLFMDVHPWVNFENMLGSCLVGVLIPEDYGVGGDGRSLEDMD